MIASKISKVAVIALSLGIVSLSVASNPADAKSSKADKKASAKSTATATKSTQSTDAGLRSQVSLITKALTDRDAKEMADLWTEDGTYIDEDGAVYKGRTAVHDRFAEAFKETGRPAVELVPDSQRFLSDSVALSEGIVRVKGGVAAGVPETRYSIVFLKQNGNWLVSSATETPLSDTATVNPLDDLTWLLGEWSAERNGGSIRMRADWAGTNKNFIMCTYETKLTKDAKPVQSRQVIGWDPRNNQPISWHFDSTGGFGYGHWSKAGKRWEIQASGVERDGSSSAATNIMSPEDSNSFMWQSLNRSVDGVAFTDTEPLKIQRAVK